MNTNKHYIAMVLALSAFASTTTYAYDPIGPQTNVPVATLANSRWHECYRETYKTTGTGLATIQNQCPGSNLMLACRPTGSDTVQLLSEALRADVLFDTGTSNTPHNANGTSWYFNNNYSWGFANQGDLLTRNACDNAPSATGQSTRLCWQTANGAITNGGRCGANTGLEQSDAFERVIYQRNVVDLAIFPASGQLPIYSSFDVDIILTATDPTLLTGGTLKVKLNKDDLTSSCSTQQAIMKVNNKSSWGRVVRCYGISSALVSSVTNNFMVVHTTAGGVKSANGAQWTVYPVQPLP
ncbi:hypothetical protein [Methylovulum psychrotolerans]|uniref:Uncharacterized protein n=1 Tax=Methylovulum psychrotolerans TaxID=1704499 RepID=A0A2S5CK81_9GAMM|nr:hypothetical protein [Methylovulum psychrotolerans]POZ51221.1 hypothetical protein AADEFJLK_03184 [Methylovulum psychrotolerans]